MTGLEAALDIFKAAMLDKFQLRADKHGDRSVTVAGSKHLHEDYVSEGLWAHFYAEVDEFRRADHTEAEMGEAVDVANMAFLIWWKDSGMP
jgi:hypothetical protein